MNAMLIRMMRRCLCCTALAIVALSNNAAQAHEGHSHAEPAMASPESGSTRRSFSGAGEALELTVVYDTVAVQAGTPMQLRLLLSDKATNEPLDEATLDLTLSGGDADVNLSAEKGSTPGTYITAATFADGVQYSLLVDASKGDVSDFFSVDKIALPDKTPPELANEAEHRDQPWQAWLPSLGIAAGAAFVGFLVGRGSHQGQKAGAK